jgi:hypothetical protein
MRVNLLSPKGVTGALEVATAREVFGDGVRVITTLEEAEQFWIRECGYPQVPLWIRAELECKHRVVFHPVTLPAPSTTWDTGASSSPIEDIEKLLQRNP